MLQYDFILATTLLCGTLISIVLFMYQYDYSNYSVKSPDHHYDRVYNLIKQLDTTIQHTNDVVQKPILTLLLTQLEKQIKLLITSFDYEEYETDDVDVDAVDYEEYETDDVDNSDANAVDYDEKMITYAKAENIFNKFRIDLIDKIKKSIVDDKTIDDMLLAHLHNNSVGIETQYIIPPVKCSNIKDEINLKNMIKTCVINRLNIDAFDDLNIYDLFDNCLNEQQGFSSVYDDEIGYEHDNVNVDTMNNLIHKNDNGLEWIVKDNDKTYTTNDISPTPRVNTDVNAASDCKSVYAEVGGQSSGLRQAPEVKTDVNAASDCKSVYAEDTNIIKPFTPKNIIQTANVKKPRTRWLYFF
jgi:hypothetical protein